MFKRGCALSVLALACVLPALSAPAPGRGCPAQDIQANEARIFLQPDFSGPYTAWQLMPDARQFLVPDLGDSWVGHIASIELGSDVGVMLFQYKHFMFSGSGYVNFGSSVPDVRRALPGAAAVYASLILYRRAMGNPLGILAGSANLSEFRFFPMPESASEMESGVPDIRNLVAPVDFVMLFFGGGPKERFGLTLYADLAFKGDSLELPDGSGAAHYQLSAHNFAGRPKSFKMHTALKLLSGTATVVNYEKNAVVDVDKPPSIDLSHRIDIAGRWRCSDDRIFEFGQMGPEFIWTDLETGVQGRGVVEGDAVKISWFDLYGQKEAAWRITARDGQGRPKKMDIGNGLELSRISN